jgi:hypothetical protein
VSGLAWRRLGSALLAGLILAGCGTQARWVNCEGRLEPINLPTPKTQEEPALEDSAKAGHAGP